MTSKSLFSKDSLFRDSCAKRIWITILSLVGFLLTITLPIIMRVQMFQNYYQADEKYRDTIGHSVLGFLSIYNLLSATVLIALAILGGLGLFYYLHSRRETDFYHSLPISRGRLFLIRYATVPAIVLPCYLVNILLGMAVTAISGFGSYLEPGIIFYGFFQNAVFFLLIYSIAVLSAIVCGNRVISVLLLVWIYFSGSALYWILDALFSSSLKTYASASSASMGSWVYTSPIVEFYALITQGGNKIGSQIGWESSWMHNHLSAILISLLVFAGITVLCYFLFRIRSSESAGNALAFQKSEFPIKVYMVVVVALAGSVFLGGIMDMDMLWMIVGAVIGGFLMHCVAEGIYHFDIRAIFHHPSHMILCGVIVALIMTGIQTDVFGYDTKTVKLDQIRSVEFKDYTQTHCYGSGLVREGNAEMTGAEEIKAVWEIANHCVADLDQKGQDQDYVDYRITFHLKSGGTVEREYRVCDRTAQEEGEKLAYSQAYAEKNNPLYTAILTGDGMDLTISSYFFPQNGTGQAVITDQKAIRQIWQTAREEYRSVGLAYLQTHVPIVSMTTSKGVEVGVYPAYTKTLALIHANSSYADYVFSASDVREIELNYNLDRGDPYGDGSKTSSAAEQDQGKTLFTTVTDRDDIQAFLKNCISNNAVSDAECDLDCAQDVDLSIQMKDGNGFSATYLSGKEPTALLQKYRALAQ